MAQAYELDDKYTKGIWYDSMHGVFAKIQRGDGQMVELINPKTGFVYWDMPVSQWVDEQSDFVRVPQEAVDDPVAIVNRALRIMSRNDVNELAGVPESFAISLRYARKQVYIRQI